MEEAVSEKEWDRIRVEGDGKRGTGYAAKVWRNGVLIPGLVSFSLEVDAKGAQTLITKQLVVLEADEDVVDRAVQALEERERAWGKEG